MLLDRPRQSAAPRAKLDSSDKSRFGEMGAYRRFVRVPCLS